MSAAFTKGPWSPRYHGEMSGTQMWFLHETGKVGLSACGENVADIRLIAEAPALYEALECIQRDIRSGEMAEESCRQAHADSIDTLLRPIRGDA